MERTAFDVCVHVLVVPVSIVVISLRLPCHISTHKQLHMYGFERKQGGFLSGEFTHPKFIRGQKTLCLSMRRAKVPGPCSSDAAITTTSSPTTKKATSKPMVDVVLPSSSSTISTKASFHGSFFQDTMQAPQQRQHQRSLVSTISMIERGHNESTSVPFWKNVTAKSSSSANPNESQVILDTTTTSSSADNINIWDFEPFSIEEIKQHNHSSSTSVYPIGMIFKF